MTDTRQERGGRRRRASATLGTFALAFGPKLWSVSLKLAKSVKAVKVGLAGASMAAYSWLYTWQFALLILAALVVHESGHVWAMRRFGLPTKGFYLIPFVGGAAISTRQIDDRWTEYLVVMAGPAVGLASALLPLGLYWLTGHPLLAAVAAWIATFNLFNLLPILPLDGGKIVKSIAFSLDSLLGLVLALAGLLVCAGGLFFTGAGLLGVLLIAGSVETLMEWTRRDKFVMPIRGLNFPGAIAGYLLLAVLLLLVVHAGDAVPEGKAALDLLKD